MLPRALVIVARAMQIEAAEDVVRVDFIRERGAVEREPMRAKIRT